jgi:hypothetical protein
MNKTTLTSMSSFKSFRKKPILVSIGKEAEGYFKRLSLEEFFDMQDKLMAVEKDTPELTEEDTKDEVKVNLRTREVVTKTKKLVISLMREMMTDDKGDPAFKEADEAELDKLVTPSFSRDFVTAMMLSQGVGQEEITLADESFRQRP